MPDLTFYRQARVDGGIRTGITVDREELWHDFRPGSNEEDPILVWYIDLRCKAKNLSTDIDGARRWLLDRGPLIREGFRELAGMMRGGMDASLEPYPWPLKKAPKGTRMTIVCFAPRRTYAREIVRHLEELAADWPTILEKLSPAVTES